MSVDKEIKLINEIIAQAVIHGGDSGGPYCSNGNNLIKALKDWLSAKELEDQYKIGIKSYYNIPDIPLIVKMDGEMIENITKTIVF